MRKKSVEQEGPVGEEEALGCRNAVNVNPSNLGSIDAQPLTWVVVNLGASEPRESVPQRELGARIPWYCKPERELYFSSWWPWLAIKLCPLAGQASDFSSLADERWILETLVSWAVSAFSSSSIAKTKVSRHPVSLIQCRPSSQFVFELVSRDCQPQLPLLLSLSFYLTFQAVFIGTSCSGFCMVDEGKCDRRPNFEQKVG